VLEQFVEVLSMRLRFRLLLVVALTALLPPAASTQAQGAALATVIVDMSQRGGVISPTFLGFSHEWNSAQQMMGPPPAPNPIYRQLVLNLLANGAGPLVVRVGGNSTDKTAPPQAGVVDPFAQLYADLGVHFILGVNLGAGDVALATDQARAYLQAMPGGAVDAIEIGNEPDLYHTNGDRAKSYAFADYEQEFATWRGSIEPLLPSGVGLVGPSWASASSLKDLSPFLDQEGQYLTLVSHHWYAGTQCNGRTNPADYLLRPQAATSGATAVASSAALAHQRGLPFRMGEINSISCGGETGVSDVFASALWASDMLFEFANVGVDGVNIHTGNGGGYALFVFDQPPGSGYALHSVRPEYYGLLLFQQAAPAGSQLLPISLSTSANVKAWATNDDAGVTRVLVLNKAESTSGSVNVQIASGGQASLIRLQAPALDATTGISVGGRTFDGSTDGTLQGMASADVFGDAAGTYVFSMPPVSAALLTVQTNVGRQRTPY
jgi:hypothetical protein